MDQAVELLLEAFLNKAALLNIGTSVALTLFLVFVLGSRWLESSGSQWLENRLAKSLEAYKAEQNRELEHYKYQINNLFNRITKIHEKEIEVLPEAWQKLQMFLIYMQGLTSPLQQSPHLDTYSNPALEEFLSKTDLWEVHKEQVRNSSDKMHTYREIKERYRLAEAGELYGEFHDYIQYNRIFLSKDIASKFKEIDDSLTDALRDHKFAKQYDYRVGDLLIKSFETVKEAEEIANTLEELIQARLHHTEADTNSTSASL